MKKWKPIFYSYSKVPVWLSKLAPLEIGAISFGPFVWARGELTNRLKTHETIHYQQKPKNARASNNTCYNNKYFIR